MRNLFQYFLLSAIFLCVNSMAIGSGKYWAVTHQWTNCGSFQTEPFRIYGKKWRIHAHFTRKDKPEISFFSTENEEFTRIFKFPRHSNQNRSSQVVTLKNKDQGDKFLSIKNSSAPWKITVEQYFDHTDDWLSRKDRAAKIKPAQTLATLSGTGNKTVVFETKEPLWFIRTSPRQDGEFQITVKNAEDKILFSSSSPVPNAHPDCFFYAPGKYTIDIKTAGIPWIIYAYQPAYKSLLKP